MRTAFLPLRSLVRRSAVLFGLTLVGLGATSAHADAPEDPTRLYALETEGTSVEVQAGEQGTFVLHVRPGADAYISPKTPLSLVLEGEGVTFAQTRLGLKDVSAGGPVEGRDAVTPRFDVPFQASTPGSARIQAKLTFFLCTASSCIRQVRELELPVRVN